jgi:hypothetical protein
MAGIGGEKDDRVSSEDHGSGDEKRNLIERKEKPLEIGDFVKQEKGEVILAPLPEDDVLLFAQVFGIGRDDEGRRVLLPKQSNAGQRLKRVADERREYELEKVIKALIRQVEAGKRLVNESSDSLDEDSLKQRLQILRDDLFVAQSEIAALKESRPSTDVIS